ncbi:glycosyltransferase family 4 protein [Erythrobacter sp.]|uniref:glycosyltransferase family 4 protein n=1 Tax=Erythrobacter sp. TaxID=1042 RepID=UPI001B2EB673|nr:glycosyltransferase family 4 protein [Erythrobacter sp.]MBO6526345.1 glycosyltransferase family 4 protein [Erythrobacter sp.]MBO6530598.1 glycosyltransferase family 4 protein [Erythrobacter sp.]
MIHAVVFAYPQALSYSGQTATTMLAIRELEALGWECRSIDFIALDRTQSPAQRYIRYGFGVLGAWVRLAVSALYGQPVIVFNHGQSLNSFLRMGLAHLVLRKLLPRRKMISSLHGSTFMTWAHDSREMRFFLRLLRASDAITVLGLKQRSRLVDLGIPANRVRVLPNTANIEHATEEDVCAKHMALTQDPAMPIVLLHLSLLIESKGYGEFLDACHTYAISSDRPVRPIDIQLVGPMHFTSYCKNFTTPELKRAAIESKIEELNALPHVSARWIEGAHGVEKEALFEAAHIFVFPSRFPVEAQPLVLLEAMAAGCALIASDQGEIPSTMGEDSGLCLTDLSAESIAQALTLYIGDDDQRLAAALAGRRRAAHDFSAKTYGENWHKLLADSGLEEA